MPKDTSEKKPAKEYESASQGSAKARKKKHRKKLAVILLIIIATMLVAAGWYFFIYNPNQQMSDPNTDEGSSLTGAELDAFLRKKAIEEGHEADYFDYLILGNEAKDKNDYQKARDYYLEAEKLKEGDMDVWYALATIYRLLEQKEASLGYFDKVLDEAGSEDSPYHPNLSSYERERKAVEEGDFNLENNTEEPEDVPAHGRA